MAYLQRIEMAKQADKHLRKIKFGDRITNVCAGEGNPHRLAYFVRKKNQNLVQATDKKGNFWETDKDVIFEGWLPPSECKELYGPIWEADFQ